MSTAPLKAYTLSLHDALPISVDDTALRRRLTGREARPRAAGELADENVACAVDGDAVRRGELPRQDAAMRRSEEHTSELQSPVHIVCRLLLEKTKDNMASIPS